MAKYPKENGPYKHANENNKFTLDMTPGYLRNLPKGVVTPPLERQLPGANTEGRDPTKVTTMRDH